MRGRERILRKFAKEARSAGTRTDCQDHAALIVILYVWQIISWSSLNSPLILQMHYGRQFLWTRLEEWKNDVRMLWNFWENMCKTILWKWVMPSIWICSNNANVAADWIWLLQTDHRHSSGVGNIDTFVQVSDINFRCRTRLTQQQLLLRKSGKGEAFVR